jgi:hypothetical protein
VAFDQEATGDRVFTLDIVNAKTTYRFTRALSLRGIVQFDSSRETVLTDFLGSYEPRPGTVIYTGYGSLIEQREFVDGGWVSEQGRTRPAVVVCSSKRRICIASDARAPKRRPVVRVSAKASQNRNPATSATS